VDPAPPGRLHIATEGPLGWSALQVASRLKLPVCSDFRTNFHAYSKHYGVGWLHRPIMAYLKKFHNRTAFTMVPTEQLRQRADALRLRAPAARHARCRHGASSTPRGAANRCAPPGASAARRSSRCMSAASLPRRTLGTLAAAFGAVRQAGPEARLVVVGDGPAAPSSCSIGCPMRCSPAHAPARTWRRTTRRPTCSSFRA